jgi:hypothetical protein
MIPRMLGSASALLMLLGIGCITDQPWRAEGTQWDRADTTFEEFEGDRTECEAQTELSLSDCLSQRGYYRWGQGNAYDRARDTFPR